MPHGQRSKMLPTQWNNTYNNYEMFKKYVILLLNLILWELIWLWGHLVWVLKSMELNCTCNLWLEKDTWTNWEIAAQLLASLARFVCHKSWSSSSSLSSWLWRWWWWWWQWYCNIKMKVLKIDNVPTVVGWGSTLQARRSWIWVPVRSLKF
jgi:hypothetical protein